MNFENKGDPICKIKSIKKTNMTQMLKKFKGKCPYCEKIILKTSMPNHLKICPMKDIDKTICVQKDQKDIKNYLTDFKTREDEYMQIIPNKQKRQIIYITGASGQGKSRYAGNYAKEYKKMFPKNDIYLFSLINDDVELNNIKNIKKINLDETFLDTPIELEDLKNCLLIFDDCDSIEDKEVLGKIKSIQKMGLECGRHEFTSMIVTSHQACDYRNTKIVLNEAHFIVIFPNGMGNRALKYLCESYCGLDKKQIQKIKDLDSRHCTIVKSFPMLIVYEKGCYVI